MKAFLGWCLLVLLGTIQSNGQDGTLNFVAIGVRDTETTIQWYSRNLGFKVLKPSSEIAPGIRFAILEGHGAWVELVSNDKHSPKVRDDDAFPEGIFKYGFRVSQLDVMLKDLNEKGIKPKHGPFDDEHTKTRSFIIEDPDKNLIQFFQPLTR